MTIGGAAENECIRDLILDGIHYLFYRFPVDDIDEYLKNHPGIDLRPGPLADLTKLPYQSILPFITELKLTHTIPP